MEDFKKGDQVECIRTVMDGGVDFSSYLTIGKTYTIQYMGLFHEGKPCLVILDDENELFNIYCEWFRYPVKEIDYLQIAKEVCGKIN